ncbi:MAG: DUF5678 domain-containing protein [Candidatus Micrarchaeota archaeon]
MTASHVAAHAWLARQGNRLDGLAGKWVAVTAGKVLAVADSPKELLKNQAVRLRNPLITKIPLPEEAYSLL